jgi:hypothetical protein
MSRRAKQMRALTMQNDGRFMSELNPTRHVFTNHPRYSAERSTSSPLLNLPAEIRARIWDIALGHRTIHIKFAPARPWEPMRWRSGRGPAYRECEGKFTYIVCEAEVSEEEAYRYSLSAEYEQYMETQGAGEDKRLSRDRHSLCYRCYEDSDDNFRPLHDLDGTERVYGGGPKDIARLTSNRLPIALLRTCRQAYSEINPIFWNTTTWSFTHSLAFSQFMHHRNSVQRSLMKRLHLDINFAYGQGHWEYGWYSVLNKVMLENFPSLEVLHLDFGRVQQIPFHCRELECYRHIPYSQYGINKLLDLSYLPLTQVSVICTEIRNMSRLEIEQHIRLDMAESIHTRLLDYQGRQEAKQRTRNLILMP